MTAQKNERETVEFEFKVSREDAQGRLDAVITNFLKRLVEKPSSELSPDCRLWIQQNAVSRAQVASWIEDGFVEVNQLVVRKAAYRLKEMSEVVFEAASLKPLSLEPDSSVSLDIIHEDESLLVLNKPAGLVVHPGAGNTEATLVHGLLHHLGDEIKSVGHHLRPGLVHRLDKDTSGLLLVTKNSKSYEGVVSQFQDRTISRIYTALVLRLPKLDSPIELPIGRHTVNRTKMAVLSQGGKEASTKWEFVEELAGAYLLELALGTGRTHQIRVHLHHVGAAIVGDLKYPPQPDLVPKKHRQAVERFGRQALHAGKLSFEHPDSGKRMSFEAPVPEDMQKLIELFK